MDIVPELLLSARTRAGLTQMELAQRAGTSQAAIARYETGASAPSIATLQRLLRAAGRRLRLAAEDVDTPVDLRGRRMRLLREQREQIRRAVRAAGASNPRIFGSVVRGEDTAASDVDILVDLDVQTRGVVPLIRLRRELEAILREPVDLATTSLLQPNVAERAVNEAVPL